MKNNNNNGPRPKHGLKRRQAISLTGRQWHTILCLLLDEDGFHNEKFADIRAKIVSKLDSRILRAFKDVKEEE